MTQPPLLKRRIEHSSMHSNVSGDTPRVIVIQGPTASGKTDLAHQIAERIPVQIISADSRQIYRGLDIGTAKPSPDDRLRYRYHGIDLCNPDEQISAGTFAQRAWKWIAEIALAGDIALIVGGSGLYVRAIVEGFVAEPVAIPRAIREQLIERLQTEGRDALYHELASVDPESALRYADRNPRRILRALEFYYASGIPLSRAHRSMHIQPPPMNVLTIHLLPERALLYDRINHRTQQMWARGLLDELRSLLDAGYSESLPIFDTIGYAEARAVLNNILTREEALARTAQRTRHYAKRQYTWLRNRAQHSSEQVLTVPLFGSEVTNLHELISHHCS